MVRPYRFNIFHFRKNSPLSSACLTRYKLQYLLFFCAILFKVCLYIFYMLACFSPLVFSACFLRLFSLLSFVISNKSDKSIFSFSSHLFLIVSYFACKREQNKTRNLISFYNTAPLPRSLFCFIFLKFFFIQRNPHPGISMVTISSVPPLKRFVYSAFSGIHTVFG